MVAAAIDWWPFGKIIGIHVFGDYPGTTRGASDRATRTSVHRALRHHERTDQQNAQSSGLGSEGSSGQMPTADEYSNPDGQAWPKTAAIVYRPA